MRILELSLRNYRVFEEVDLELPSTVIGIFGPNGSGKSTLMESIAVALYGVGAARTKKQEIRTHGLLTDCDIRLVFEHGGQQYETRRSLKGRGHTPEAELFAGGLLLASGVTEVDAEVQRLLHMDLGVFRASVYAEQKQLDAFSEVTSGKRKEMALRLLGIRPVDDARKAARLDTRSAKQLAEQLAGAIVDIAELEGSYKEAKDRATEAAGLAKAAAAELKEATKRSKAARETFGELDAARQRVEKLRVEIDAAIQERDGRTAERTDLAARVAALGVHLATLPSLQDELAALEGADEDLREAERATKIGQQLVAIERTLGALAPVDDGAAVALADTEQVRSEAGDVAARAIGDRDRAAAALEAAQARVDRAGEADPSAACPTCGQPLGEGFAAYVKHVKAEATQAKAELSQAKKQVEAASKAKDLAQRAWTTAREAAERAGETAGEQARLAMQIDTSRTELAEARARFGGEVPDLAAMQARAARARELSHEISAVLAEKKHGDQAANDLETLDGKLAALDRRLEALTDEADRLAFDPRAFLSAREALSAAEEALESAQQQEREALGALATAEKEATGLAGRLEEARLTEHRVGELRSDARYLERTAMLLDGFRDHLVARVGPELSREAESLFRELTNHEYDDLRIDEESLAIQIADGDSYFPVERFSGSETDLANLALRVAISTHLSRVSGADLGMMVLDEVFGSLDQERKDLMVRTMGRVAGRFHQLFVITHSEQLKDQFPVAIQVTKRGRRRSEAALL
ncbi:MAG: SMC family ATPase [Actinomycetota bacterium]|nr:SMC family ATPase [Actinomycetota bacterium]